jgi:nucleoside-diphosphate-sugar epimerase
VATSERFLITGANGCIGAWAVRQLVDEGVYVVALDLSDDDHRLRLLLSESELGVVQTARVDITDLGALERVIDDQAITHVIHLAALQVPFCRADPPLGARVNVVGTVNVLEAIARRGRQMAPLVYASSIAAYEAIDSTESDRQPSAQAGIPGTLYGVFKRANEGAAAVYWRDRDVASVGLRPHTVYGPGRDQGLTSSPTSAMLAAAAGRPYRISYGGRLQIQYAPDVAAAFIAAARAARDGASVHNLAGHPVRMSEIVAAIEAAAPAAAGTIGYEDVELPFPGEVDSSSLADAFGPLPDTSVRDGIGDTVQRFRRLLADGLVLAPDDLTAPAAS